MAQISVVTQQELKPVKSALTHLAENLDAHVGETISKAHGFNLYPGLTEFDPGSGGNDLTRYFDSHGDEVGNRMLQVIANGTTVYVPCKDTTLAGQPLGTGSIPTGTPVEDQTFSGAARANWVTAFASTAEDEITATDDLLLAHTAESQATVHGGIEILPAISTDSAGHVVGDRIVTLVANGVKYKIPASSRLGGPFQGPRNVVLTPASQSIRIGSGDSNNVHFEFRTTATGTAPLSYQYQFLLAGITWTDITPGTNVVVGYTGGNSHYNIDWTGTSSNLLTIVQIHPGSNDTDVTYLRCVVTNSSGSSISNTCKLTLRDDS